MAIPKITGAQRDFSAGEIDVALKRADENVARQRGMRQMQNWRILNSNAVQNRPGKTALFPLTAAVSRVDEVTMTAGAIFKLVFSAGKLQVVNSSGAVVQTFTLQGNGAALPWASNNLNTIVFAIFNLSIYICFGHSMRPQVVTWDGASTWSIADYNEALIANQKRTPFFRISAQGVTMQPAGLTGSVNLTASQNYFTAAMIGSRLRFNGRQCLITNYGGGSINPVGVVTVEEPFLQSIQIQFGVDVTNSFRIGEVVNGAVSGAQAYIAALSPPNAINVTYINNSGFTTERIVGPSGSAIATGFVGITPQAIPLWDEEVMNTFRGFPASCFVDQFRLGFCDFPSVPGAIVWSAINNPTDLFTGALPSNSIFEIAPDKVQVRYVVPGPESSEFVFCDKKVYYIPINATNPLTPSSVSFQILSSDGSAAVQPRAAQELILYAGAGGISMMAVIATGAYQRPFNTRSISQFHGHLFPGIVTIAAPNADGTFTGRYAYVLNSNGSIAVGKYTAKGVENDSLVGWAPWSGGATVNWVAALGSDVIFSSSYFGTGICEILDDGQFLDSALLVNNLPSAFTPPGGKGPLWFIPSQTVTLMDQATRVLGTYQIDANGNLIAQNNAGEDFTVATLTAGQPWTSTLEPFVPDAQPGQSVHQRMFKRRVSRMAVYVVNSTGFLMARLFSGPVGPNQPALGTIMNQHRVTTYNQDDDPTKAPFQREEAQRWRPLGRYFDPRVAVIKDTPGPLQISEFGIEASI
jgi:hypothetical protein